MVWSAARPGIVDTALSFAFLILVPSLLYLVATDRPRSVFRKNLHAAAAYSFPFALAGAISLVHEPGLTAAAAAFIWLIFTLWVAGNGIMRLLNRGIAQPDEALIDVGLTFLAVGGVWLVLARAGAAELMPYSALTVDLTAVHYHYSAFVLPLFAGLFGRWLLTSGADRHAGRRGRFTVLAVGIAGGSPLVALGISQGQPLERITVALYIVFIYWLCLWVIVNCRRIGGAAGTFAAAASITLMMTMGYSFLFSLGLFINTAFIPVDGMLRWHGALNAFGFSVFGTLAWFFAKPEPGFDEKGFPISRLRMKDLVRQETVQKIRLDKAVKAPGLLHNWNDLESRVFEAERTDRKIREFYTSTVDYSLYARIKWNKEWMRHAVRFLQGEKRQFSLPHSGVFTIKGSICDVNDSEDGRKNVRGLALWDEDSGYPLSAPLFYSTHETAGIAYMNIANPFRCGVITRVLRPGNSRAGALILTGRRRQHGSGDEGLYFTLGKMTVKLPVEEEIKVDRCGSGLRALHEMTLFGISFLKISYSITRRSD
ncbi:YndJ family protein [Alteribacter natronophilus]|uniref:YndJ family protein n=1 Tax=Alteribacter natronophilus TaxID=2583810 RepID=UPI0014876121|nr:YndJ family protein [Alteribacter natronophilus]